jgi:H+-transporting ATPase
MSAQPTTGHEGQIDGHHEGQQEHLNEKKDYGHEEHLDPKNASMDEEEDEDMDALIEELESQDANVEEEEETAVAGAARTIPEELLQTSTRTGLTTAEVQQRLKKYGKNQMKEEKENLILKFLGFFVGPIQFVMEVSALSRCRVVAIKFVACQPRSYRC